MSTIATTFFYFSIFESNVKCQMSHPFGTKLASSVYVSYNFKSNITITGE